MTERFVSKLHGLAVKSASAAALIGLAACADMGLGGDKTAEAGNGAAVATTRDDAGGGLGLANCSTPSEGRIHFKVADTVLAVPGNIVTDAIPAGMQPPLTKEKVVAEVKTLVEQGVGCPGTPMDAGLLLIKDTPPHPLLEGNMGLLALPPGGITARFAAETKKLQDNPPKGCQPIPESDLIACAGKEKRGDTEIEVLYVITTDKTETMVSGGPLAARCTRKGEAIEGCNLVDQLPGGLAVDASLKSGRYTTKGLREALDAAIGQVNAMRVGGET